jgi:copper chaperone
MTDTTQTFEVRGMTCDNCVQHVTRAVSGLAGVSGVQVSLAGKSAVVQGAVDPKAVIAAIEEEGYEAALRN